MWTDRLYSGVKTGADVARSFIFSPEFGARKTTNEEFAETLYTAFFNRAADAGGFKIWTDQLNGGQSRATVLDGFIRS